jgi:DNA-nicking Smr family endonuclease
MAKKKATKKNTSAPKEFSSSPFKDLKGLSAFKEPSALTKNVDVQKSNMTKRTAAPASDGVSFADEMDFLGVKPLPGKKVEAPAPKQGKAEQAHVLHLDSKEERDKETFLDALGAMETTFVDEWSEDEPVKKAAPRRMKQVERGQLKPEAELDLHGLTVEESCAKVRFFLHDSLYQGFQTTLIITGKGLHSNDGPVLRQAVERMLETQRDVVLEWGLAPQRYGGSGALIIFLRQSEALPFP